MSYLKPELAQDIGVVTAIIVGGMGIAGVILGLYCSSIASIYSQKYSSAPKSISDAFHRDIITNKSIKQITGFIAFGSLLLFECVAIRCPYFVSVIVFLVLAFLLFFKGEAMHPDLIIYIDQHSRHQPAKGPAKGHGHRCVDDAGDNV